MDNYLYVVHSSETEEQLNKFDTVLKKAGFNKIKHILDNEYVELLDKEELPNFTLCVQRTYRSISSKFSNKINVEAHEFFSKEYVSKNKNLCLSGLPFSINEIFNDQYKRYAWKVICNLYENYSSMTLNDISEDHQNSDEDDIKEVEIIHQEPSVIEEPKCVTQLDIKDSHSLFEDDSVSIDIPTNEEDIKDSIQENKEPVQLQLQLEDTSDYEFYKSFYNKYSKFIKLFEELKVDVFNHENNV